MNTLQILTEARSWRGLELFTGQSNSVWGAGSLNYSAQVTQATS